MVAVAQQAQTYLAAAAAAPAGKLMRCGILARLQPCVPCRARAPHLAACCLQELQMAGINFKAFDLGGHEIARRVWKDYYAKVSS